MAHQQAGNWTSFSGVVVGLSQCESVIPQPLSLCSRWERRGRDVLGGSGNLITGVFPAVRCSSTILGIGMSRAAQYSSM